MKNITAICMEVTKREGGKKQVSIAQVREIVGIMSDLLYPEISGAKVLQLLKRNGKRRQAKK